MRVDVKQLFQSIGRITWRHGVVSPERLKHIIEPDGSHRIELKLQASEVIYVAPSYSMPKTMGAVTPEARKPTPEKKA